MATSILAALLCSGCASFSGDGGIHPVASLTQARTGHGVARQHSDADAAAALARSTQLLNTPLSADAAVELALLNNRSLQAGLAGLGVAEADWVRAGRLRNPSFSFGRLAGAGGVEVDRALGFDLLGLLTMPLALRAEQGRFDEARLQVAAHALDIATEARRAYFGALAAQQLAGYARQVGEAAGAAGELARRMQQAGNFSPLEQLREQAFHAEAVAQLARATQRAAAERERLVRALGLTDAQLGFVLPERLPALPAQPLAPQAAEQAAIDQRLDVLMSRRATQATAEALGLGRATRFVNVLQAGYQNKSNPGVALARGYTVELELPLFDFGSTRIARAEASYAEAVQRTAAVALNAQSEVREAHAAYHSAHALALHYRDEVVPLAKRMSDQQLLRYNGMLGSVFELLADARAQIVSVSGAIEALRDFWLADTQLQVAMGGRLPAAVAGEPAP